MKDRLIVALDVPDRKEAQRVVRLLQKQVSLFKVGLELFTAEGPDVVSMIHDEGGRVFLDLKFHDIPNTVARACASAARLGVFMMNVHARGGREMMKAASQAVRSSKGTKPILLGVTVLTSDPKKSQTSRDVARLARDAKASGLNGIVCSPQEAASARKACGKQFVIVTPGIRPAGAERGDQRRVTTPSRALRNGSDYLVVGRPILQSQDPQAAVSEIIVEMMATTRPPV